MTGLWVGLRYPLGLLLMVITDLNILPSHNCMRGSECLNEQNFSSLHPVVRTKSHAHLQSRDRPAFSEIDPKLYRKISVIKDIIRIIYET